MQYLDPAGCRKQRSSRFKTQKLRPIGDIYYSQSVGKFAKTPRLQCLAHPHHTPLQNPTIIISIASTPCPWPPPSPTQPFRQHPGHENTPNDSYLPILRYYGERFSLFRLVPERRSSYAATATCVDGETPMAIADILVIQSVREGLYAAETTIQGGLTMSLADGRVKYCYC